MSTTPFTRLYFRDGFHAPDLKGGCEIRSWCASSLGRCFVSKDCLDTFYGPLLGRFPLTVFPYGKCLAITVQIVSENFVFF